MIPDSTAVQVDLGGNAAALLERFAANLGVAAGQVWPALVAKVRAEAPADLIVGTVLAAAAIVIGRLAIKYGYRNTDEDVAWLVAGTGAIVTIMLTVFGCALLYESYLEFVAPEAVAFLRLLKAVTGK